MVEIKEPFGFAFAYHVTTVRVRSALLDLSGLKNKLFLLERFLAMGLTISRNRGLKFLQITAGRGFDLSLFERVLVGTGFQMGGVGVEDPAIDPFLPHRLQDAFVKNLLGNRASGHPCGT